jgi:hypothetical protein
MYLSGNNLGIGTTTPLTRLDVNGDITASSYKTGQSTVLATSGQYSNVFLGPAAGLSDIAGQNKGVDNTFLGRSAGTSNTTGARNTFTGAFAGTRNITGNYNTFSGEDTGFYNTSGSGNTFTGRSAGYINTTGMNNIFEGWRAGILNTTGSSDIYIGNQGAASGTESNTIRIGDPTQQNIAFIAGIYASTSSGGVPVYINSSGQLGTSPSSLRFKEQVRDMGESSSNLMQLRPVTFLYKAEFDKGQRTLQYGLIAEEVARVYPNLVAYEPDGKPYTVKYQFVTTMLLNEAQKQYRRAEAQAAVITQQEEKIEVLEHRLSRLEAMLGANLRATDTISSPAALS